MHRQTPLLATLVLSLGLLPGLATPALSQDLPGIIIASSNRDSILKALRIEANEGGLTFKKLDSRGAHFEMDAGQMPVRGEFVTILLLTTVRFDAAPEGTRLTVTELLSAAVRTGSETRRPDPSERWDAYMAILRRTKARIEQPAAPPADSAH